jgi:hypothetical protein
LPNLKADFFLSFNVGDVALIMPMITK